MIDFLNYNLIDANISLNIEMEIGVYMFHKNSL